MLKFMDLKGKKGITILVLSITIIILLILAGISVATLTGDNGLIKNVRRSKSTNRNRWRKRNARNFNSTSHGEKQIW